MYSSDNERYGFGEAAAPRLSIAVPEEDVLPRVDRTAVFEALRRLPEEELETALRLKLVPMVSIPGLRLHAACGSAAYDIARERKLPLIGRARRSDFLAAVRAVHGRFLAQEAALGLARRKPIFSARQRLTSEQASVLLLGAAIFALGMALLPLGTLLMLASGVGGVFFLAVVALRVLCLLPPPATERRRRAAPLTPEQLPTYSVLVPLFRETPVLPQLLGALQRLQYPSTKLDIKLILEEEDVAMQRALAMRPLPRHFEVIVVPAGRPQTKPRALNYALQFCRGELVTIYDAEDIPEPDQLRKAAQRFAEAPPELACLQAGLAFYNAGENWLARQFTAEYALLFQVLLPVLASHRLPLLLGGTSNHFRTAVLRAAGAWDAFNVTEDADLGLRLARLGYQTGTLDSLTYEEANTRLGNWMRQRARWLKGFLATWLVHMREPRRFIHEVGPAGFWTAQVMTLGVFASALLHPPAMVATAVVAMLFPSLPEGAGLALVMLAGVNLFVLLAGYAVTIGLVRRGLRRRGITGWTGTLASLPLYWMLMSAAAWLALWQFMTAPFHWNKTEHGLSKLQRPQVRAAE